MRRRAFIAATTAAASPLLAGCGGGGEGSTPDEATIRIEGPARPQRQRLAVGGTVTWVNANRGALNNHTVTSASFDGTTADWEFRAELPEEGAETSHTFEETGVYGYYDELAGLECRCGAILVGDVELDEALPCSVATPGSC